MTFAGWNYLAVLVAAVLGFGVGAIWYNVLAKPWMAAVGKTPQELKPTPGPFILSFVAELVMAWVLAGVIGHLGVVSVRTGLITAALLWLGLVITTVAVNNAYRGAKLMLTVIDGGHWLAVLLVMGLVIGLFGA